MYFFLKNKWVIVSYYLANKNIDLEFVLAENQKNKIDLTKAKYVLFANSQFKIGQRTEFMKPMYLY